MFVKSSNLWSALAALFASVLLATHCALAATTANNATTTTAAGKQVAQPAVKVNFTDCGPNNIKEVRISPCNLTGSADSSVCSINLGSNVTVEADFVAKSDASSLSEQIKGVVRGRELPFPEQRKDPCKSTISPHCPIKTNSFYKYKAKFEIKPYYPAIPVKVRYALVSQAGEVVACVQIGARIVDPNPVVKPSSSSSRNKSAKKKNNADAS